MTIPALVMWAVVAVVGLPSALRNPTALALVISWLAAEAWGLGAGDSLPVQFYPFLDIFVISIIMTKDERSVPDRIVLSIFPICWVLYVADVHPFYKWYLLWGLTIIQFLAAGWDAFSSFRRDKAVSDPSETTSGDLFRLAWGRGYG